MVKEGAHGHNKHNGHNEMSSLKATQQLEKDLLHLLATTEQNHQYNDNETRHKKFHRVNGDWEDHGHNRHNGHNETRHKRIKGKDYQVGNNTFNTDGNVVI